MYQHCSEKHLHRARFERAVDVVAKSPPTPEKGLMGKTRESPKEKEELNPAAGLHMLDSRWRESLAEHHKQIPQFIVSSWQINCGPVFQMKAKNGSYSG